MLEIHCIFIKSLRDLFCYNGNFMKFDEKKLLEYDILFK